MKITARFGDQCLVCGRVIERDDTIEWEPGGGACHVSPTCDEAEEMGRRIGSGAEARPLDLPKYREEGEAGAPADGWESYRPSGL